MNEEQIMLLDSLSQSGIIFMNYVLPFIIISFFFLGLLIFVSYFINKSTKEFEKDE